MDQQEGVRGMNDEDVEMGPTGPRVPIMIEPAVRQMLHLHLMAHSKSPWITGAKFDRGYSQFIREAIMKEQQETAGQRRKGSAS